MENKEKKRTKLHKMQENELRDVHNLIEKEKKLKKGGRSKHHSSQPMNGSFMKRGAPHGNIDGGSLTNLHIPKEMEFGKSLASTKLHIEKGNKMKKGGHCETKVYKHGGHHYTSGGTVYEHEMVGEHPSRSFHHYNYEGMMRGEHPVQKSDNYANGGHDRHKYAAGGVAKIRHNAATSSGKPIHHQHRDPSCKVRVY
jgi:hypothetical protein